MMSSPFDEAVIAEKKGALKKAVLDRLKEKMQHDFFWSRAFFKAAAAASEGTDATATFEMLDMILGDDHDDELKELFGGDLEKIAKWLQEDVLTSQQDTEQGK